MSTNPDSASRSLPERPDLRHLKDQAKDLLKAGAADSLSKAQFQLSRQYGFSSWPKLKSHVESLQEAGRLKQAIDSQDYEIAKEMLTANPALHHAKLDYARCNPLTWVAECRGKPPTPERLALAQWMVENGSDPNQGGGMPLNRAALYDERIPMMEVLVANGANIKLNPNSVGGACECLAPTMLKWLLDHGATTDIDDAVRMLVVTYGRGPGRGACLEVFAEMGYEFPDTAPMAVHRGRIDLLEACLKREPGLLEKRFDETDVFPHELGIKIGDGRMICAPLHGATLLHMAVELYLLDVAEWLIERGADVNARAEVDSEGFGGHTPLYHTAVTLACKDEVFARLLLSHGADPSARTTFRHHNEHAGDGLPREYHDVTAIEFARQFPAQGWVNEPAIKAIQEYGRI